MPFLFLSLYCSYYLQNFCPLTLNAAHPQVPDQSFMERYKQKYYGKRHHYCTRHTHRYIAYCVIGVVSEKKNMPCAIVGWLGIYIIGML